jgi:hypothetical protein
VGSVGLGVTSSVFYRGLPMEFGALATTYVVLGFFVGTVGAIPHVLVNAFPAALRFSGLSFSYNVSYAIFGGLTPVVLPLWIARDALAPGHYMAVLAALGAALAFVPLPKTAQEPATEPCLA